MGTIAEKLSYLNQTKADIKQAIIDKGVAVADTDTFRSYATKIGEIQSGGGTIGEYLVRVIDYDGTVIKEEYLDTGATFTLPNAPTNHSRLVFQEWSSPVNITDNTITVEDQDITIGAVYTTASGLNEFDIELTKATGRSVTLNMDGTKNWGDGISDTATTHTYTNYGDYTITCDGTTMTTSSSSGLFGQTSGTYNFFLKNAFYANIEFLDEAMYRCSSLTNVTISNSVTITGTKIFQSCCSLTNIIIPGNVTSIGDSDFNACYSLTNIIIPSNVTSIGDSAFGNCYSLTNITIPSNVTSIGKSAFRSCHSLTNIIIPSNVTSIGDSAFMLCYSLKNIIILSNITSIGDSVFYKCSSMFKCVFTQNTGVPSLLGTSAFYGVNELCKLYVPDTLYNDWRIATNWNVYSEYIYKASEMEN